MNNDSTSLGIYLRTSDIILLIVILLLALIGLITVIRWIVKGIIRLSNKKA